MACEMVEIGLIKIKMYNRIVKTMSNVHYIPFLRENLITLGILDSFSYQYLVACGVI